MSIGSILYTESIISILSHPVNNEDSPKSVIRIFFNSTDQNFFATFSIISFLTTFLIITISMFSLVSIIRTFFPLSMISLPFPFSIIVPNYFSIISIFCLVKKIRAFSTLYIISMFSLVSIISSSHCQASTHQLSKLSIFPLSSQ